MSGAGIVIIGGGFTGAAIAYHLALAGCASTVFEPRESLGAGLAYGTQDPVHRINVPAAKLSLIPDDELHFVRWLEANRIAEGDPDSIEPDGCLYSRRSDFGRYMAFHLAPMIRAGLVRHRREKVVHVERRDGGWLVRGAQGGVVEAERLVIATSHPPPSPPEALQTALSGHPRFIADPTATDALQPIRPADRVLIVGTGLTMADVVASLDSRGHRGPIQAISRRGQRSQGHAPSGTPGYGEFLARPSRTAASLVRTIRRAVDEAAEIGLPWQSVFDTLRRQGQGIWAALPLDERRRLVRHLRPFWDTRRFRIAPAILAVQERLIESGRLEVMAASLKDVQCCDEEILVTLRPRGRPERVRAFDAVIVTTGPAHGEILASQPYLAELTEAGILTLDPTGIGIACTESARAIGADGQSTGSLLIAGPLARATFGELMGLPEVARHAVFIAVQMADSGRTSFPVSASESLSPRRHKHA